MGWGGGSQPTPGDNYSQSLQGGHAVPLKAACVPSLPSPTSTAHGSPWFSLTHSFPAYLSDTLEGRHLGGPTPCPPPTVAQPLPPPSLSFLFACCQRACHQTPPLQQDHSLAPQPSLGPQGKTQNSSCSLAVLRLSAPHERPAWGLP